MANALESAKASTNTTTSYANIWSAADKGDTAQVKAVLEQGRDVNGRNCLGCTPLLYACGSGHIETVKLLLQQSNIDVNRRNNDRLTSFMLAMQGGPLIGPIDTSWSGWESCNNTHDKLRRLMDLPASIELELSRHDRWTALMEACNFGHKKIVELLLAVPSLDLEAMNIRGQRADEVAASRGHDQLAQLIQNKRLSRDTPEELQKIQELEEQVETLKMETRNRLCQNIDKKYEELTKIRSLHEKEIETMTRQIDSLQEQLEEAMKSRLSMITRQVRIVKNAEEEIRQMKRKLENFDRYASTGNLQQVQHQSVALSPMTTPSCAHSLGSLTNMSQVGCSGGGGAGAQPPTCAGGIDRPIFDKDFECSVCLDDMRPPIKIFQCRNGHVMCESCKNHPEVVTCPTCRIPLPGADALMRNIPMEKLARSYFEKMSQIVSSSRSSRSRSQNRSRSGSYDPLLNPSERW